MAVHFFGEQNPAHMGETQGPAPLAAAGAHDTCASCAFSFSLSDLLLHSPPASPFSGADQELWCWECLALA